MVAFNNQTELFPQLSNIEDDAINSSLQEDKNIDVKFFPYCEGIPWTIKYGYKIMKSLDKKFWNRYVKRKILSKTIICNGGLFEILVSICSALHILNDNHIEIHNWYVPRYFYPLLDSLKIQHKQNKENYQNALGYTELREDMSKLRKMQTRHSVPIFYQHQDVFFNLLLDYCFYNHKLIKNVDPFYNQILDNLCLKHNHYIPKEIDKDLLKPIVKEYLNQFGYNYNDNSKYFILNNSVTVFKNPYKKTVVDYIFSKAELKRISYALLCNGIKCIVLTNNKFPYKDNNIINIPSWIRLKSNIVCGLLANANGIMACDPNLYLSAALLHVPNIICLEQQTPGFTLEDVRMFLKITKKIYNWENDSSYDFEAILEYINKVK